MIDPEVFQTSRELARSKMPAEEARNSFGYYIDIPNDWESYKCPEELIRFLGIHSTHIYMFNELIEDLGPLADNEREWAKRYVVFCEKVTRLLCTNGASVDLRYDIAETLSDWRTILNYVKLPCHILEYGAGCGRQGISAFLRNPNNTYTAIDSTLAAYTLQNLMFSHADTLGPELTFFDFLDFETAGLAFPQINNAKPGSFFHVPAWLAEDNIPENFYDLIIAAHVHNELSKSDFLRLIKVIDKGWGCHVCSLRIIPC